MRFLSQEPTGTNPEQRRGKRGSCDEFYIHRGALRQAQAAPSGAHTPRSILARLDRIGVWSMPFMFVGIIGLGFMFAFYDVFDINVSFIQSCVALKHGCTPANAVTTLRIPVVLNLAGYVIGALVARADVRPRRPAQHAAVHDAAHRPGLALQRARARLHAVRDRAGHHRHRRRRRPGHRQHLRRRGRAAAQPRAVDLGDLHHVFAGGAAGHLARLVPDYPVRPLAPRPVVRPGRSELQRRLALDVRGRRAAGRGRRAAAPRAARVAEMADRASDAGRGRQGGERHGGRRRQARAAGDRARRHAVDDATPRAAWRSARFSATGSTPDA